MADYLWPEELAPYGMSFYLQSHTGRSQSPFTRQQKIYGLSAPLWMARLSFRGGYDGSSGIEAFGPTLDALLARLKGGQNRVGIWDFRRDEMRGIDVSGAGNEAAAAGAQTIVITGLDPGDTILAGDYFDGDGRPHIITADAVIEGDGSAALVFEPPLLVDIAVDAAVWGRGVGWFRFTSDDAGSNMVSVGEAVTYDLEFIEDTKDAPAHFEPDTFLTINGISILIASDPVEMS